MLAQFRAWNGARDPRAGVVQPGRGRAGWRHAAPNGVPAAGTVVGARDNRRKRSYLWSVMLKPPKSRREVAIVTIKPATTSRTVIRR